MIGIYDQQTADQPHPPSNLTQIAKGVQAGAKLGFIDQGDSILRQPKQVADNLSVMGTEGRSATDQLAIALGELKRKAWIATLTVVLFEGLEIGSL